MKLNKCIALGGILATAGSLSAADGLEIVKGVKLSGFLDMSFTAVDVDGAGGGASTETRSFNFDQSELDLDFDFGGPWTARLDVSLGKDPQEVEQARINYASGEGLVASFGKWDTFIGLEGLEPTDVYQFSNALTWNLEPTHQTGMYLGYEGDAVTLYGAIVNGLGELDNDSNDEFGGYQFHLGFTPTEAISINGNYLSSAKDDSAGGNDITLLTFDISYNSAKLLVGAEYVQQEADAPTGGKVSEETAMTFMVNYCFTESFALTFRYGMTEGMTGGDLTDLTISPSFVLSENLCALIEYRIESADSNYAGSNSMLGAVAGGDATQLAFEMTYSF